tara:strand:- start:719 stop:997 length:279 start_codon:yes stop_codon:yes gene_type:complete
VGKELPAWQLVFLRTFIGASIAWAVFVTSAVFARPDRSAVVGLIESRSPYVEDRKAISQELAAIRSSHGKISGVIDRNTEAINLLRIAIGNE